MKQKATLTLVDEGDGFRATVQYQPSLKNRTLGQNSPCINAMVRLCLIMARIKGQIGAPLTQQTKRLTLGQKVLRFFNGKRQEGNTNPPASVVETPTERVAQSVLEKGTPSAPTGDTQ